MRRMLFFLGKGGVGKSTISSTVSYQLSRQGSKVLLISLDPAHNLGDIFNTILADNKRNVAPGLDAMEIDLQSWIQRYLKKSRDEIISNYNYNLTINLDSYMNILKYSPGTQEYATLWAIEHIYETWKDEYEFLVFDTPPTALTMQFLAMPSITRLWVKELSAMRAKILSKRQTVTRLNPDASVLKGATKEENDKVSLQLGLMSCRLEKLFILFTQRSYMSLVINDDRLSLEESKRIRQELQKLQITLNSVCLNKLSSVDDSHPEIEKQFAGFPINKIAAVNGGIHCTEDLQSISIEKLLSHINQQETPA
ncbi:ArsA family ATPase [Marispirochaeta sp.]|jgi:arsenite/tail-anchored protein-transporting ATPase|uniref:ArsA family ATPase n=1 Tax=Marispirochaeta sp. TaxID=2038653 RepID=UPI0029C73BC9|nr:ArsA family ATPase [Marispirochaeta sp.]